MPEQNDHFFGCPIMQVYQQFTWLNTGMLKLVTLREMPITDNTEKKITEVTVNKLVITQILYQRQEGDNGLYFMSSNKGSK